MGGAGVSRPHLLFFCQMSANFFIFGFVLRTVAGLFHLCHSLLFLVHGVQRKMISVDIFRIF